VHETLARTFSPDNARKLGLSLHEAVEEANEDIADRGCGMVVVALDETACTFACRNDDCSVKTGLLP
jgi:hypothetical protein